ncbi:hypothetical protein K9M79_07415 [Candidatus Woesearchaeota archaeon]|nr:hypothetical protein [Candidatus Woesearchaeota archaeon]
MKEKKILFYCGVALLIGFALIYVPFPFFSGNSLGKIIMLGVGLYLVVKNK